MADPKPLSLDPEDYDDVEIDDPDNPEWTEEDFARARPLSDFPELQAALDLAGAAEVTTVTLELPQRVIEHFKSQGDDWRARIAAEVEKAADRAA